MFSKLIAVFLVFASYPALGVDYGELMATKVKAALGNQATRG